MKFSQIERGINNFSSASRGDKKFNRVFHPVSTTSPHELKNDNSLREQGITIASILTDIGMAIGVPVEALLPGSAATASRGGGEPPPKDEKGLKEWVRNKLKALASLLGKLGMKAAETLPGIIGGIISWILNRAKDVVGWVLQNLLALVVGIGGLIYTYMVTRK